jgi:hypothetical protein
MNISVSYGPDRGRSVRIYLRLHRTWAMALRSLGVLFLLAAVITAADPRGTPSGVAACAVIGVILLAEPYLVFWVTVRRNWAALAEAVTVTLTDAGVTSRTATAAVGLSWDKIRRVVEGKGFWIFAVNRFRFVSLWKGALTPGQADELAAFLDARRTGRGPVPPPVTGAAAGFVPPDRESGT